MFKDKIVESIIVFLSCIFLIFMLSGDADAEDHEVLFMHKYEHRFKVKFFSKKPLDLYCVFVDNEGNPVEQRFVEVTRTTKLEDVQIEDVAQVADVECYPAFKVMSF